jgi:hypothetical protein
VKSPPFGAPSASKIAENYVKLVKEKEPLFLKEDPDLFLLLLIPSGCTW